MGKTYITLGTVIRAVKALGLTCVYKREYDEFKIDYREDDKRRSEDSCYYTTYRDDAIATAIEMSKYRPIAKNVTPFEGNGWVRVKPS